MPKLVPLVPSIPNYRAGLTIESTQYLIDVRWNGRMEVWFLDLMTEAGEMIKAGIAIVLGAFLGRTAASADFPGGAFVAVDTSNEGQDAGIDDLGTRVLLYYYSEEELAALG